MAEMTDEEHTLRMTKAQISLLPADDQHKIAVVAQILRGLLAYDTGGHVPAAIALVGAELAAQS